ncbi:serine protease inhibitor 77Ba-like [Haematobia irritans]|uniref:serine protease inhibitor 77Ba-like n=1 Tax=Haematobia irritans TaxID=7368 RepID=UPI003F509C53
MRIYLYASLILAFVGIVSNVHAQKDFSSLDDTQSWSNHHPRDLVFASSNNQPITSRPNTDGTNQLLFSSSPQSKPYDETIFQTSNVFFPRHQENEDRPPIFASNPTLSPRDSGLPIFASAPATSRHLHSSNPMIEDYDMGYSTSAPSFSAGRSSSSSSSLPSSLPALTSSLGLPEINVKIPSGPPIFASSNMVQSLRPAGDFGLYAEQSLRNLSKGAEEFSLNFLAKISDEHLAVPHRSYMVSPLSVWSLLVLLTEGAEDNTLKELRHTLRIKDTTPQSLRSAYRQINQRLNTVTNFVEVAAYQAIFTDINKPVQRDYEDIIEREYRSVLTPVNFADINTTFVKINDDISKATRGLLSHSVLPQDLIDVHMLMISSLYFKGKWKSPFESYNTHLVPFHDEAGNVTGNVEMMMQAGTFNYAQVKSIDSHVLELPYGDSNHISMLVILPRKGTKLNDVVHSLCNTGISSILERLQEEERSAAQDGFPSDVEVYLPKFTTQSHFSVKYILENMGLIDIFQPSYANLTKISKDVYVSSIFQSTRIIVNEEGTEASALSVAALVNKASPVRFYFDRPFAYLIVEKTANLLLFAGEIKSHM